MNKLLRALCIVFFAAAASGCETELHKAVSAGNATAVKHQLRVVEADVNATDLTGHTPLHRAMDADQPEIFAILIDAGADVNAADIWGQSLTDYAIANGHVESAIAIINKRAADGEDVNAESNGRLPLHSAVAEGQAEIALAIVRTGANIDTQDEDGNTPLHIAALEGQAGAARALLGAGAYPESKNKEGETPLHVAAIEGQTEAAVAIAKGGANINAKGKNDTTPLHFAAVEGHTETAVALIEAGANVNATNLYGETPVNVATAKHGEDSDIVVAMKSAKRK